MKSKLVKLFFTMFLIIVLAACNNDNNDNNNNNNNGDNASDDNISSISTDQSSNNYPHTQPIQTQEAKYKFRETPNRGNNNALPDGEKVPNTNNTTNKQQPAPQQQPKQPAQNNNGLSQFERDVVTLTNNERQQAGLSAFEIDSTLSQVAREKSNDMQQKGYFSHTSPTYGSPFDMMRDFGVTYKTAGENIAQGQSSPEEVVQAWMNSQGHRENILNPNFTHIGVGFEQQGKHWTQMFIGK